MPVTFLALWGNSKRITDPAKADASIVVTRPWGFEARVDYSNGKEIYNEVLTFSKMPDGKILTLEAESRRLILEKRLAPPTKDQLIAQLQADLTSAESELSAVQIKKNEILARIAEVSVAPKEPVKEVIE